jgi:hypothetical protein
MILLYDILPLAGILSDGFCWMNYCGWSKEKNRRREEYWGMIDRTMGGML